MAYAHFPDLIVEALLAIGILVPKALVREGLVCDKVLAVHILGHGETHYVEDRGRNIG